MFGMMPGMMGRPPVDEDAPIPDTSETVHVSSIALLKMLKHCRDGVPIEVMGLMLGEFVDEYNVNVVDVFAMPQTGTSSTVDSLDPAFQADMLALLAQTGRTESVVGWYHSHPGYDCWLSGIDQQTQSTFERLNPRCVAVVVDPIQSVRGKVVIGAFRLLSSGMGMAVGIDMGVKQRQTTSNRGYLTSPSIKTILRGLGREFYGLNVSFERTTLDERVLTNLDKKLWSTGMSVKKATDQQKESEKTMKQMLALAKMYQKTVEKESLDPKKRSLELVGHVDPKRNMDSQATDLMTENIVHCLDQMIATVVF